MTLEEVIFEDIKQQHGVFEKKGYKPRHGVYAAIGHPKPNGHRQLAIGGSSHLPVECCVDLAAFRKLVVQRPAGPVLRAYRSNGAARTKDHAWACEIPLRKVRKIEIV